MGTGCFLEALEEAIEFIGSESDLLHSGQGGQFTGSEWIAKAKDPGIRESMDGRGGVGGGAGWAIGLSSARGAA